MVISVFYFVSNEALPKGVWILDKNGVAHKKQFLMMTIRSHDQYKR